MKNNDDKGPTAKTRHTGEAGPGIWMSPAVERRLKWDELRVRIEHYKYYLSRALHVTVFFSAIAGGVLGFYLNNPGKGDEAAKQYREQLEFILLLPILVGSVLGGVFIYGARLQEKAVDSMEHIREQLRERLGLDVEELYDAQLLNILLRIFGYIYFFVTILLGFVPKLTQTHTKPGFTVLAIGIFFMGVSLPVIARRIDKRLKVRRTKRTVRKLESWRCLINEKCFDVSLLQHTNFYHDLRSALSEDTIKSIINGGRENTTESSLNEGIDKLERKLKIKELESKALKECLAGIKRQRLPRIRRYALWLWDWWTDV